MSLDRVFETKASIRKNSLLLTTDRGVTEPLALGDFASFGFVFFPFLCLLSNLVMFACYSVSISLSLTLSFCLSLLLFFLSISLSFLFSNHLFRCVRVSVPLPVLPYISPSLISSTYPSLFLFLSVSMSSCLCLCLYGCVSLALFPTISILFLLSALSGKLTVMWLVVSWPLSHISPW